MRTKEKTMLSKVEPGYNYRCSDCGCEYENAKQTDEAIIYTSKSDDPQGKYDEGCAWCGSMSIMEPVEVGGTDFPAHLS